MSGRRGTGIIAAGMIRVGMGGALIARRLNVGTAAESRVGESRPLHAVILRDLLIWPLLILVGPLLLLVPPLRILIRPLLILIWPLLILIRPLLVLVRPLLISVWALIRGSVLPGLELGIAKLAHYRATIGAALAGNCNRGQKKA